MTHVAELIGGASGLGWVAVKAVLLPGSSREAIARGDPGRIMDGRHSAVGDGQGGAQHGEAFGSNAKCKGHPERRGWLVSAAVPVLVLGLAFYVFTAARFDLRELFTGHGDHWVAGGALAISALAAGKITEAAGALGQFSEQHQILTTSTLGRLHRQPARARWAVPSRLAGAA